VISSKSINARRPTTEGYLSPHQRPIAFCSGSSSITRQCLDRRIGERDRLVSEIAAWQQQRNASGARIEWKFNTQKARQKLARAYPDAAKES
jgi:hypothetical protein